MNEHVGERALVEFFDGTLPASEKRHVARHLEHCAVCRARVGSLATFDAFVQARRPEEDTATAAMFELSARLLTAPPRRRHGRVLLCAALLALAVAIGAFVRWTTPATVQVVRYAAIEATRATAPVRYHLALALTAPAHVIAFARLRNGEVVQLLPEGESVVSPIGAVRLPADPLLDWEHQGDRLPLEMLVVLAPEPPRADLLARLRPAFAAARTGTVPHEAMLAGEAHLLPFPPER